MGHARTISLALALAGCNTQIDPCAALINQTCLTVRARGSMPIDQLELLGVIGVQLPRDASRTPPVAAGAFDLPAVTALALGDFEGAFVIRVRGLLGDMEVGAGLAAGDLQLHQHRRVDVDLRAGEDGGGLDSTPLGDAAILPLDGGIGDGALLRDGAIADAAGTDACTSCGQWASVGFNLDPTFNLYGVWGASPNDLFIVGETSVYGVILRGHDEGWSSLTVDNYRLTGVWGTDASNVYVSSLQGLVWHFDGFDWLSSAVTGGALRAVSGAGEANVFVVGTTNILRVMTPRGNSWQSRFTNEAGWSNLFYGVWLASTEPVFTVGYRYMAPSTAMGAVRASAGSDWFIVQSVSDRLNGVWGSSENDVYAVGAGGTVVHKVSASTWVTESVPRVDLNAVWGSGPNDVYAVGAAGTLLHRDATGIWRAEPSNVSTTLHAVFGVGGVVYVVGDSGVILRKP